MKRQALIGMIACFCACALLSAQPTDPTPKLLEQLKSKSANARMRAMTALAELGPKAAPAVDALASFLPGIKEDERVFAAIALGKIGKASIPAAVNLLGHEDETTRFYAVWVLGLVGKDAKEQTPRLLTMLKKDADDEVRIKVVFALARIAPESKDVVTAFKKIAADKEYPFEKEAVIEELRHLGPGAIEPLVGLVEDPILSAKAVTSLNHLLDHNRSDAVTRALLPHVPDLLPKISPNVPWLFPQSSIGDGFAAILARHGDQVVAEYEKRLADKDRVKRDTALQGICALGDTLAQTKGNPELLKKIVKVLQPRFKSPDDNVRRILASSAPLTDETEPAFDSLLLDDHLDIRQLALAKFSQQGMDWSPRVLKRLNDAKGDEKVRLACALYTFTQDDVVRDLLWSNTDHKDASLRLRVACALVGPNYGPENSDKTKKKVIPVLVAALKSESARERLLAARALATAFHGVDGHVPAILAGLDDPSVEVQTHLLQALKGHSGVKPAESRKAIARFFDHADDAVRFAALEALNGLGKDGVLDVARFAEKDPSPWIWGQAIEQLKQMGNDADEAVPALLRMAGTEDRRAYAVSALLRIAPDRMFAPILGIRIKQDEKLRKAMTYPKAVQDDPKRLTEAITASWKKNDAQESARLMLLSSKLIPLLPPKMRSSFLLALSPRLGEQIDTIGKELKSKDVKVRMQVLTTLGEASKLWYTIGAAQNALDGNTQGELNKTHPEQQVKIDALFNKGRSDSDLQVRRHARKMAHAAMSEWDPTSFVFPPGLFIPGVFPRAMLNRFILP